MLHHCIECQHCKGFNLSHAFIAEFCSRTHTSTSVDHYNEYTGMFTHTTYFTDTDFSPNRTGKCKHFKQLTWWEKFWHRGR